MEFPPIKRYCWYLSIASLILSSGFSCRGKKQEDSQSSKALPQILEENRLGGLAGPVYQSQAASTIPWQPWGKDAFRAAEESKRLVLAVVVLPQEQRFNTLLSELASDSTVVKAICDHYIPVLIDGDAVREMGLLADPLCREINRPLDMPLLIWLTPKFDPVAWIPVVEGKKSEIEQMFGQSHGMVSRIWKEDPEYVLNNSALDAENRRQRILKEIKERSVVTDPVAESLGAARQLLSLYDPLSRTLDHAGGLFPVGPLDVAVVSGLLPDAPEWLRERGEITSVKMLEDLLRSAMFDPLDGGAFSGRAENSWSLPKFSKNCQDQAKVAFSLFRAHLLTGDKMTLERALGVVEFAERNYSVEGGLFCFGPMIESEARDWMWTVGEVREVLSEEDANWWIAATGMEDGGNLPVDVDTARIYFRANTLSLARDLGEVAKDLGVDEARFAESIANSRETLRAHREKRWKRVTPDETPNAAATFRMVSAYAAAFTATGEHAYREKAVSLLDRAYDAFFKDGVLRALVGNGEPSVTESRAFGYALAVQACLDVADTTLDASALETANSIAQAAVTQFSSENGLMEVSATAALMDFPIIDIRRLYDDSTAGIFAQAEARSGGRQADFCETIKKLAKPLPSKASAMPILYSDSIQATLMKYHSRSILMGKGLSEEMTSAVSRLPLQLFSKALAEDSDGIPDGSVRIVSYDGAGKIIANPADLLEELLLSAK